MPALDPSAESAAATNMGFIFTACFCTSLVLWMTRMSQVPVTEMKDLAHYRGSQSKMCQGIKCLSEKHLYSTASSPANGCTCLGFMCTLFVCPSSHSLAPQRPSVLGASGLRSLDGAGLIPFFQQDWEKQWLKHFTGGQRREERMPTLLELFSFNFCYERNWK